MSRSGHSRSRHSLTHLALTTFRRFQPACKKNSKNREKVSRIIEKTTARWTMA
jgi:hypothetical protein